MHRNVFPRVAASWCQPGLLSLAGKTLAHEAGANLSSFPIHGSGPEGADRSVGAVFFRLLRSPFSVLVKRWNWKSAVLSSLFRAAVFFFANLSAGLPAALAAMQTELFLRAISSGFYGALTESFREAEPPWAATLAVAVGLPFANHSIEFLVHWMRGTRKLVPSILSSVGFTLLSTLFNFYAMRRGALVVGEGRRSLAQDLRSMPRLLLEFVLVVPRSIRRVAESLARFPNRSSSSAVCPKD